MLIADSGDNAVRRLSPAGVITAIAGQTDPGSQCPTTACGDGGSSTAARLNSPFDVEVDPAGGILVADEGDSAVRWLTGPQGAVGPTGPQGVAGVTGPQGVAGLAGAAGAQGPTGPAGPQGPNGGSGAPGHVALVTCTTKTKKLKHHKTKKVKHCTTRTLGAGATFAAAVAHG